MTDPQIRYWQLKENQRHNVAQEENWQQQLSETVRSNQARESLAKYQTDVSSQTSRYVADKQASTAKYVSDQNVSLGQYTAGLQAEVQKYVSDQTAETQRYSTNVNAATQRYTTDVNAQLQSDRLKFDVQTQAFRNGLEAQKVDLQRIATNANAEYSRAQAQRAFNDIRIDIARLGQDAQRLGLDKQAAKYNNALTLMRTWETFAKTSESGSRMVLNLANVFEKIVRLLK